MGSISRLVFFFSFCFVLFCFVLFLVVFFLLLRKSNLYQDNGGVDAGRDCFLETEQSTDIVHVKWSKTLQCREKILTMHIPVPAA